MKDVVINNISYNAEHWTKKTEADFVKYYMDCAETKPVKDKDGKEGKAVNYIHKALFERRNKDQREALLKEHYAKIISDSKVEVAATTTRGDKQKQGGQ